MKTDMVKKKQGKWILVALIFLILGAVYLKTAGHAPDEMIIITGEAASESSQEEAAARLAPEAFLPAETEAPTEAPDPRISLNQADKKQLMTLPMIGEVRARAIIDYRTEHGPFSDIADIMKVSGIGKGIFERIKDKIRL